MFKRLGVFVIGVLEAIGKAEISAAKETYRLSHPDLSSDNDWLDKAQEETPSVPRLSRRVAQASDRSIDDNIMAVGGRTTAGAHMPHTEHNVLDDDGKLHSVEDRYDTPSKKPKKPKPPRVIQGGSKHDGIDDVV